jgi:riboflavin kinase/FMN adenylyltransferase
MSTVRLAWNTPAPQTCRGGILTVGNFDGVHKGHALLLERAKALAAPHQAPAVAVTFDPHPLALLRPEQFEPMLSRVEDRARWLHEAGADHVVVLQTDPSLLSLTAEEFFQRVIRENLAAIGLVEGPNFGFGRKREGNLDTLARLCEAAGITLDVVPPLQIDGNVVSSSRIRKSLLAGNVAAATRGLGRPYCLTGVVGVGQRRGQSLGFPTANLTQVTTLIPGDGVYAVRAWERESVGAWAAAANIGPNPTFGEQVRKIEVHLIGFNGDLYGKTLTIEFSARLRDTRRFESVADLLEQIKLDIACAQSHIAAFRREPQAS